MKTTDLNKFCQAIQGILSRVFEPDWFQWDVGLCSNARFYDQRFGTNVQRELKAIFGDNSCPFNESMIDYHREVLRGGTYKNPFRLSFIESNA